MKTQKFGMALFIALLGSVITLFVYTKFIEKPSIVYQYPSNQATLASYSGEKQQIVDFTFAAEQTVHAVVHVRTKSNSDTEYHSPLEFLFGNGDFNRVQPVMGFGSGVIISTDGYIVTNNHVIKDADEISVKLNDNREFEAKLVAADPSTDIALLKIDASNLPIIPFGNSDDLRLGEWVLAVGNPFNLTSTVTAGIISAKARNLNILNDDYKIEAFIQTDAALNPGNSGGALVNVKGELVGINTAIISPTGGYSGYSFAVPVTIVKKVVDDLREFGLVQRAFLGINNSIDVNADLAKQHKLNSTTGVYINNLKETGSAKDAGMKEGDVIVKINSVNILNVAQMQEQLSKFRPKDKITVTVFREGKEIVFDVVLRNRQGDTKLLKPADGIVIMGAKFNELSGDELRKLGIRYGVKIVELKQGRFSKASIEEGFIVTRMNNKPVTSVSDIKNILKNSSGGVYIEGIYPNGMIAFYSFGL
jgi:serine protease Do